jgi:hypothetical protein
VPGVLETLARVVGDALSPMADRLQGAQAEQVLEQLGLRLPPSALAAGSIPQRLRESAQAATQLPPAVTELVDAVNGGDEGPIISAALQLALRITAATEAFVQLGTTIDATVQGAAGLTPAQKARLGEALDALPERLLHVSLISFLEDRQPSVKGGLDLVGLFDDELVPGDPADASLPPYRLQRVRFDRLTPLLTDPAQHLSDLYGFGRADFDGLELFRRIKMMVDSTDFKAILIEAPGQPAVLEVFLFRLAVVPGSIPGLSLRVRIPAQKNLDVTIPIAGPWSASVTSTARFEGGIELLLHPVNGIRIEPPTAAASIEAAFGLQAEAAGGAPMILIGQAGGSRLELQRFSLRVPIRLSASIGVASPEAQFGAELELKGGKLVIDASQADGFISTILGGIKVESAFEIGAAFDTANGLRFTGSATIEIAIPSHLELGPLKIPNVYIIGGFQAGTIPIELSADLGLMLGPIAASVNRLGAKALISFPPGGGNAGVAQVDIKFKPPNGVGLAVDAGPVKGGGYLYIDTEREEYAGALELVFSEWIALRAIGIITTRMPDGSKGFSMLIIITVEFGTGIQLGFGFTLIGVGGLIGIHRVVNIEPLAAGVRTGAIESVMFPQDIIANAPRIISDLRAFFPPQQDMFLIGPMAKIGWGTPTLLSVSLGIILEIPSINITILGVIKVVLPTEEADILRLQVNFIGRLEPANKLLWFYAELYDSRVLFITLEGGMGLLVRWGDQANFVVSVGGFHPRYNPPPLPFPSPPRLAVSILNESYARIRVEAYFAVTSNSVQFGAHAELFFGLDEFCIEGHLGFDALFQFDPFFFSFGLSISLSVKVFGIGLFSVGFSGLLEGPTPWHIEGRGSISVLFFSISVPFSHTWGDQADTKLDPIEVFPLLEQELSALTNWRAELPKGNNISVSLRKLGEQDSDRLVLHPVGTLKISQRRIPLNLELDKVGTQSPSDANLFSLVATVGGGGSQLTLQEPFATGQFVDLGDSDRLSSPGFSPEDSGVEIAAQGEQRKTSQAVKRVIRYESIIIDNNFKRFVRRSFGFFRAGFAVLYEFLFGHFLSGSAVKQSTLSKHYQTRLRPFDEVITVQPHGYSVAYSENNQSIDSTLTFTSQAKAVQYMNSRVAADPALGPRVHVIPNTEVDLAA